MSTANTAIATAPTAPIVAAPYKWLEPSELPPRPWIYGNQLLRGSVSMIIAPGGSGKTALATGMALSMATGREFMGSKVWGGPKRVWIWNLEDSVEELSRGIQAAASYWFISEAELTDNLFLNSALSGDHLKLVTTVKNIATANTYLVDGIVSQLVDNGIDVLFIDPFVSCHDVNENDNKAMDLVVKTWADIAFMANCSIVALHHTNKGLGNVTENSSRGASSVVNAARSVVTINPMSSAEGKIFGIDEDEISAYIKLHDNKNNRISACRSSTYMKFESVMMETSDGTEESIGILIPVNLEKMEAPILTEHQIAQIQMEMECGYDRSNHQSEKYIGKKIAEILKIDLKPRRKNILLFERGADVCYVTVRL